MSRDRSLFWTIVGFPVRAIRALPRTLLAVLVIVGFILNVLVLTSPTLNALATDGLAKLGVTTVAERDARTVQTEHQAELAEAETAIRVADEARLTAKAEIEALQAASAELRGIVQGIAGSMTERAALQATRATQTAAAEAVPFAGTVAIAATLSMEIGDACDTAKEASILTALTEADSTPDTVQATEDAAFDCRETLGDVIELPVAEQIWQTVTDNPEAAWQAAQPYLPESDGARPTEWEVLAED